MQLGGMHFHFLRHKQQSPAIGVFASGQPLRAPVEKPGHVRPASDPDAEQKTARKSAARGQDQRPLAA